MKRPEWTVKLKPYERADVSSSILQLITTIVPYLSLMGLMLWVILNGYSYWFVLLLSVIAAPFLVRIFIVLHDCTHYSFLPSKRACDIIGHICGLFVFTSFYNWKHSHVIHHATVSNLDKRGIGDVWTMTVDEYNSAPLWKRFFYRSLRHPAFLFIVAPLFLFLVIQRFPLKDSRRKEKISVLFVNLFLAVMLLVLHFSIGIVNYILLQLPVLYFATAMGVWLFFIQHQFRNVYWAREEDLDKMRSVMEGCSYYKLPGLLRWASGNIGYHHLHHLAPRVPNYKLKKCFDQTPELQQVAPVSFFNSFGNMFLALWDEKSSKLVSFKEARTC